MSEKRKSKWDQPAPGYSSSQSTSTPSKDDVVVGDPASQNTPTSKKWDQPAVDPSTVSNTPVSNKWDQSTSGLPTSQSTPTSSKWDQPVSGISTSQNTPPSSKWDQPASGISTSQNIRTSSKWDQPLGGQSTTQSTPKSSKWDQPATGPPMPQNTSFSADSGSSLAAEAVARITSMLSSQKRPQSTELPPQVLSPSVASIVSPYPADPVEIKLCVLEYPINDSPARMEFLKSSVLAEVNKKSGALLAVKGKYLSPEEKSQNAEQGEKPLHLLIQAPLQANVDAAVRLLKDIEVKGTAGVMKTGGSTLSSGGGGQHYVQDKVFVGLTQVAENFDLKEKLQGTANSFFDHIMRTTGARIHLRGRGSGYIEPTSGKESFEALYIYIQHGNKEGLSKAKQLCDDLVRHVQQEYEAFQKTNSIYASFNPYQSYNAYSYLPHAGAGPYGQTQTTSSIPATQGESVAMDTPISSNHNSLSTVKKEVQKRRFVEKIPVQEPDVKNEEIHPMVDKEPQVVKEEGDREESPENSAKLPAIVKPDMPPPSFVPQVKSGVKRPSEGQTTADPSLSPSNPLNKHFLEYNDSDSDNDS